MIATSSQVVGPRRVVIAAPITLGYGSPRYLRLNRVLRDRGHRVLVVDHEEPPAHGRRRYRLPGVRRLTVCREASHCGAVLGIRRAWERRRRQRERPDVLIAGTNALLNEDWPGVRRRVTYFGEIESEWIGRTDDLQRQTDAADAVIAPQEDRLELARSLYRRASAHFLVYNAPLRREMPAPPRRRLPADRPIRVLYQGQISGLSCADALLDLAERGGERFHLHLAGPVAADWRPRLDDLAGRGRLTYHGYVPGRALAALWAMCDVGLITWREGGDLPLSIKYACPNKLYEYIATAMPVVFLPNYSLGEWNRRYGFGVEAAGYTADAMAEALAAATADEARYVEQARRNAALFVDELNFEHQSRPLVDWIERERM
ncbi:MAG: glycosyltransferase family 4 protein [Planctomycetes bacterium]|nr:glycosyltransferase family 4 protein [Planctomycetota bacterium]